MLRFLSTCFSAIPSKAHINTPTKLVGALSQTAAQAVLGMAYFVAESPGSSSLKVTRRKGNGSLEALFKIVQSGTNSFVEDMHLAVSTNKRIYCHPANRPLASFLKYIRHYPHMAYACIYVTPFTLPFAKIPISVPFALPAAQVWAVDFHHGADPPSNDA